MSLCFHWVTLFNEESSYFFNEQGLPHRLGYLVIVMMMMLTKRGWGYRLLAWLNVFCGLQARICLLSFTLSFVIRRDTLKICWLQASNLDLPLIDNDKMFVHICKFGFFCINVQVEALKTEWLHYMCTCDELKLKKTNISHECNKYFFLIQTNKFGNCYKYNLELLQIHFAIRRCISSGELEANTRPLQNRRLGLRNVFSGFACEILLQEYFRPLRQYC